MEEIKAANELEARLLEKVKAAKKAYDDKLASLSNKYCLETDSGYVYYESQRKVADSSYEAAILAEEANHKANLERLRLKRDNRKAFLDEKTKELKEKLTSEIFNNKMLLRRQKELEIAEKEWAVAAKALMAAWADKEREDAAAAAPPAADKPKRVFRVRRIPREDGV